MVLKERVQAGGGGGSDTGGRGAQHHLPTLLSIMWPSLTSPCCGILTHSTAGPRLQDVAVQSHVQSKLSWLYPFKCLQGLNDPQVLSGRSSAVHAATF